MEGDTGFRLSLRQPTLAGAELFSFSRKEHLSSDDHDLWNLFSGAKAPSSPGPVRDEAYQNALILNIIITCVILLLLAFFEFTPEKYISNFYSRKLTHMSMGACKLLVVTKGHLYMRIIIALIAIGAILTCLIKPFRFSKTADKGVILYNVIVCGWVYMDYPLAALAPMFFADPCGAIVGNLIDSPRWFRNKTVAGTIAVFLVTFLTAFTIPSFLHRIILAVLCCLLEAVGGDYDNFCISVPLIIYYLRYQHELAATE